MAKTLMDLVRFQDSACGKHGRGEFGTDSRGIRSGLRRCRGSTSRRSVLERNRNSGDLEEAIAQAQIRYEDAMRARGLDPSEFIGDSGRIAYPPLDFANAANRAAAQEMYRRGGMAALAEMDPEGYGAYKDFEPTAETDAYAEYLLPPASMT